MDPFLLAAIPERVTVLRLPLLPYSVGHEIILRRLGSPFLANPLPPVAELVPALFSNVLVCSLPYAEALDTIETPDLEDQFRRWRKKLGRNYDVYSALVTFAHYIRDGSTWPQYGSVRRKGWESIRPGSSWPAVLLTTLLSEFHLPLDIAMSVPLGLAQWLYCVSRELQGHIRVRTPTDDAARKALLEAMAAEGLRPIKFSECDFPNPHQCNFLN